eukprot:TRINITY_DN8130_c0_g2_i2.p1 TRINITY_DN8130_c0_g2~~TRINITY_DN8130_c0_g2_i2.p1  ORF type:complete len:393 (-),score=55.47 TRINITY_DN8130_c0_g2_i2:286-1305(-)
MSDLAIDRLHNIFPHQSRRELQIILESHNWNCERAVQYILDSEQSPRNDVGHGLRDTLEFGQNQIDLSFIGSNYRVGHPWVQGYANYDDGSHHVWGVEGDDIQHSYRQYHQDDQYDDREFLNAWRYVWEREQEMEQDGRYQEEEEQNEEVDDDNEDDDYEDQDEDEEEEEERQQTEDISGDYEDDNSVYGQELQQEQDNAIEMSPEMLEARMFSEEEIALQRALLGSTHIPQLSVDGCDNYNGTIDNNDNANGGSRSQQKRASSSCVSGQEGNSSQGNKCVVCLSNNITAGFGHGHSTYEERYHETSIRHLLASTRQQSEKGIKTVVGILNVCGVNFLC